MLTGVLLFSLAVAHVSPTNPLHQRVAVDTEHHSISHALPPPPSFEKHKQKVQEYQQNKNVIKGTFGRIIRRWINSLTSTSLADVGRAGYSILLVSLIIYLAVSVAAIFFEHTGIELREAVGRALPEDWIDTVTVTVTDLIDRFQESFDN